MKTSQIPTAPRQYRLQKKGQQEKFWEKRLFLPIVVHRGA